MHTKNTHIQLRTSTYMHKHIHTNIQTTNIHTRTRKYAQRTHRTLTLQTQPYRHTNNHTYTHTHTHTHTHTNTHTQTGHLSLQLLHFLPYSYSINKAVEINRGWDLRLKRLKSTANSCTQKHSWSAVKAVEIQVEFNRGSNQSLQLHFTWFLFCLALCLTRQVVKQRIFEV